ncbi:elicitor-responsive protein 3-like [Quercus lobata]|uniref:C2 domain-containing protein n=1 Tax=Quercus lobata TaxID=97700 RepID=A0A7N2MDL6_QUELO|nr:elicitor-responsive protein 3-like [Quercus lobata]
MPQGTLEVLLVTAKDLNNTDFFSKMDPFVILTCRTQEQRSTVSSGQGSEPQWNENFVFTISDGASELNLKIMDKDTFTKDDFVGEATIPLEPVFMEGSLRPTAYSVVKDGEYCGEIRVGLTFTPESESCQGQRYCEEEVNYGGWKEPSREEETYGEWRESSMEVKYGGWKESSREEKSYGGWKESSREEESYGGWKESTFQD